MAIQLGILLDEELRDWFVNKCRTTRSTDASKRLLSAAQVISAYLEYFREIDNINPWGIIPQLKEDFESPAQSTSEASPAIDWDTVTQPIKQEIEQLKANYADVEDYRQKLVELDEKLTKTIDEKISEAFAKLHSEYLLNPIVIPDSDSNSNVINVDRELESDITKKETLFEPVGAAPLPHKVDPGGEVQLSLGNEPVKATSLPKTEVKTDWDSLTKEQKEVKKQELVRLVDEESISRRQAASKLGINPNSAASIYNETKKNQI